MNKVETLLGKIWFSIKKYKYAALLLVVGISLLLLPGSEKEKKEVIQNDPQKENFADYTQQLEDRLCQILSQIRGVGKVEVILTLKQGEEHHYLYDESIRTEAKEGSNVTDTSQKTVIFSQGSSYDEPMITRTDYPLFQGALIVCEGGGDAEIKLQLTQAVSALTNLSSHNITILKMK